MIPERTGRGWLVYDCEIVKAIPPRYDNLRREGIEYCDGWRDFENMGISTICAYDFETMRYRVFCEDGFGYFEDLVQEREVIVSFNGVQFDDNLCAAHGIKVRSTYDLLWEMWLSAGLRPPTKPSEFAAAHKGFGLDATAFRNGIGRKSGHGELAPILWQQGKRGQVIDYCLEDVRLTAAVLQRIVAQGELLDPRVEQNVDLLHGDALAALAMPHPNDRYISYSGIL